MGRTVWSAWRAGRHGSSGSEAVGLEAVGRCHNWAIQLSAALQARWGLTWRYV